MTKCSGEKQTAKAEHFKGREIFPAFLHLFRLTSAQKHNRHILNSVLIINTKKPRQFHFTAAFYYSLPLSRLSDFAAQCVPALWKI